MKCKHVIEIHNDSGSKFCYLVHVDGTDLGITTFICTYCPKCGEQLMKEVPDDSEYVDNLVDQIVEEQDKYDALQSEIGLIVERLENAEGATQTDWEIGVHWANLQIKKLLKEVK